MTLLLASIGADVAMVTSDSGATTTSGTTSLDGKVAALGCDVVLTGAGSWAVALLVRRALEDAGSFRHVRERIGTALVAAIGSVEAAIREHMPGGVVAEGAEPAGSIAVAVGWDGGPVGVVATADGVVDLAGHAAMPSEPIAADPELVEMWNATATGADRDALLELHRRAAAAQMRAVPALMPPVIAHVVGPGGVETVTLIGARRKLPMTVGAVLGRNKL